MSGSRSPSSLSDWKVIDRGVNGQPFLWKNRLGDTFVMIDIFNPDLLKRCYSVFVLHGHRTRLKTKKEVVGFGCADEAEDGWIRAYDRARKIAEQFMTKK